MLLDNREDHPPCCHSVFPVVLFVELPRLVSVVPDPKQKEEPERDIVKHDDSRDQDEEEDEALLLVIPKNHVLDFLHVVDQGVSSEGSGVVSVFESVDFGGQRLPSRLQLLLEQ